MGGKCPTRFQDGHSFLRQIQSLTPGDPTDLLIPCAGNLFAFPFQDGMRSVLNYHRSRSSRSEIAMAWKPRVMAGVLAAVATLWCIFCALIIFFGNWKALALLGPGYLVTLGYYWRAIGHPSLRWRRIIWGVSGLVQGAWLLGIIGAAHFGSLGGWSSSALFITWWSISFGASLAAFVLEE